jgi:hypothetical protein
LLEERERLTKFWYRERKSLLTTIPTIKIVDIGVNVFYFMRVDLTGRIFLGLS